MPPDMKRQLREWADEIDRLVPSPRSNLLRRVAQRIQSLEDAIVEANQHKLEID